MSEVLALKYRPKKFEDLIGQDAISQTLSLALDKNRLSHAYLFSGLRGSGKTSTARIFSKALICEKGPTSKPCEVCEHCIMANENRHIDIIEMDAASSRKIEDIRDLIEQTRYKPAMARYKIFIIDEVHMLTKEAFNALLKTLEEPPPYVKFILATTDPLKLPPTILSRTQHFRFKKISNRDIVHHLAHILHLENIDYEPEALDILSRSGSGSLRDTLTLLDQAIIYTKGFIDAKSVSEMLGLVDPDFIDTLLTTILKQDRKSLTSLLSSLESFEAEMVIDEITIFLKERLFDADPRFSSLLLDRFFRILADSKSLLVIGADGGFVLALAFFKMMEAMKLGEIDQLIGELEENLSAHSAPPAWALQKEPKEIPQKKSETLLASRFDTLVKKLYDRNIELGECFKKSIRPLFFEDNTLTWISCADEECRQKLKNAYGIIRHFVQDIFGIHTKIVNKPCDEESKNRKDEAEKPKEPVDTSKSGAKEKKIDNEIKALEEEANAGCYSMLEKIEGDGSCNGGTSQELDKEAILNEPMVKRAQELFEAKKVIIRSKV